MGVGTAISISIVASYLKMNNVDYNWRTIEFEKRGVQEYVTVGNVVIPERFIRRSSNTQVFELMEVLVDAKTKDEL